MANTGDTIYRDASVWKRLPGNTTTTKKFLNQTGNGTSAAAPAWAALTEADIASALSNTTSAHNALSNIVSNMISAGGGGTSVTSNELSAVSAQAASALSQAVSVLSQRVSVTNASLSNLTSAHNALSNVVSNMISAGGGGVSVTSNELSAVSAQAASAISNLTSAHNALSNVVSNMISAGGGGVSVTSNELSAVSAQALSALNVLSNAVSALSASHTSLVNRVSANSATGGGGGSVTSTELSALLVFLPKVVHKASDETRTSTNTLSNDASLFFSVDTSVHYCIEAQLLLSATSIAGDWQFAITVPANASIYWGQEFLSTLSPIWNGPTTAGTATSLRTNGDVVVIGAVGTGGIQGFYARGTLKVGDTSGVVRLQHAQNTINSQTNTVCAGSFLRYQRLF